MTRVARDDWWDDADIDRLHVFVPAVMGVGVLVSLGTLLRDAVHRHRARGGHRAVALTAAATARAAAGDDPAAVVVDQGLRGRTWYLAVGVAASAAAVYVAIGATANYIRPGGYVSDIAWLWATSLLAAAALAGSGVVCLALAATWPSPPTWSHGVLVATPIGRHPTGTSPGARARTGLTVVTVVATGTALALVVAVRQWPNLLVGPDEAITTAMRSWPGAHLWSTLDALGRTELSLALVLVISVATLRCPPYALVVLGSVVTGLVASGAAKAFVGRDRPAGTALATLSDSFPSGHAVQAIILAGLLPAALWVLTRRRWPAVLAAAALGVAVLAAGVHRVQAGFHWPLDVVGGLVIGGAIVLAAWWVLDHTGWHAHCRDCPWQRRREIGDRRHGLVAAPEVVWAVIRWATRAWVVAAVAGFAWLALRHGVPRDPDRIGLASALEGPLQVGLLVAAAVSGAVAWRWEAVGAVGLALSGAGLGVLAAVAYHPLVATAVTVVFLVPAVGTWLHWQRHQPLRRVAILAIVTTSLLGATWVSATTIYDHFVGPAHPESTTAALPVDSVAWVWSGALSPSGVTIVAGVPDDARSAGVVVTPADDGARVEVPATVEDGVARARIDGLAPDRAHDYVVVVDGRADTGRGRGAFRTAPTGAASFTVAAASCARTGSDGAVFDAIRAVEPLLYVQMGDLHYGDPQVDDVRRFASLYRRVLTAPAQAALYRSTPVAYVWDDHDFGGNDSDAAAVARPAAQAAFRTFVPHQPLATDAGIQRAFTIGRVRFVITDNRSYRTGDSMLGAEQLAWFLDELVTASATHAAVVWVNSVPWIAPADPGRDDWGGYADERRAIADAIATHGIDDLVIVSGDAHMVAIDDGRNADYSDLGEARVPVLHAAALDRPGNVKGGPYSEGAVAGAGQFGTLAFVDDGIGPVSVTLAGHDWTGATLLELTVTLGGG
ncbi:MAG TPA: alkaline phosphatase D family protein [Acidimicrobiales bacterium]|nr:alkaline phosphatase D family protein [Acidimicrobiales bacterium]